MVVLAHSGVDMFHYRACRNKRTAEAISDTAETAVNNDHLFIGIVAFVGGVVSNIVHPKRRGAVGMMGAAIVGAFAGFTAAMVSVQLGWDFSRQFIVAAIAGVFGDRTLTYALRPPVSMQGEHVITGGTDINIEVHGSSAVNNPDVSESENNGDDT